MQQRSRLPLIAGNWKMNTTVDEARRLVSQMAPALGQIVGVETVVCPPFVSLAAVKEALRGTGLGMGAQNLYFEEKGAYTGEISPGMLAGLCEYVIIGHSERRQYFGETGTIVNKKLRAAMRAGLKPILCVGERLEENEGGKTAQVVVDQIKAALVDIKQANGLVIAYEPIWAIGTGRAATGRQSNETIGLIRETVANLIDRGTADEIRILYGGSVTAENIAEFISQSEIDGGLVGGASLKAEQFLGIVQKTSEIKGISG
jgi:triosephosphate isomerase